MQQPDRDGVPEEAWELDFATVAVAFGGDLATVSVVRRERVRRREIRDRTWTGRFTETAHRMRLVTLERLGGGQPEMAERVEALLARPEVRGEGGAHLMVDVSRVGTAVLGAFRERRLRPRAYAVGVDLGDVATRVLWGEVVSVLRTEMQARRFQVAPGLALAGPFRTRLVRELKLAVDGITPGPPATSTGSGRVYRSSFAESRSLLVRHTLNGGT